MKGKLLLRGLHLQQPLLTSNDEGIFNMLRHILYDYDCFHIGKTPNATVQHVQRASRRRSTLTSASDMGASVFYST